MKRVLAVLVAALVLPAAAQAKELTSLSVCGPKDCEDADVTGFGHGDPLAGETVGPLPGSFYRLDFGIDGDEGAFAVYYEPVSGLAAVADRPGVFVWARLVPKVVSAVKEAASRVEPFPVPRITGARVGSRQVSGNASTYSALLRTSGPPDVPETSQGAVEITLQPTDPNPWTDARLLYFPEDKVLFRSPGTYVRLADGVAADVEAARPLGGGQGTTMPWIPIGVALAGGLALLALALRRALRPAPTPATAR